MTKTTDFTMSRRSLFGTALKGAAGAALGAALPAAMMRPAAAAERITVADPGGPYSPAFRKAFYDPFEKATGIQVVNVAREAEPTAQFKAIVETGSYSWDVCTLTLSARDILAKQNLLEPLNLPAADAPGLMPEALTGQWMGTDVYSTILGYRSDKFASKAPQSWADFWNVETFPGRRSLRKNPIDTLEQALLADGVPLDALYPLDVDRAYKSLDRIRQHIAVWWTGGAQSTQLIQSGEVDMIALWNARAQAAIDGGAPVKISWGQGLYSIEGWGIPKGNPRADAARQFIKFCADPQRQAVFTEVLAYGPTNLKAYDSIPKERAQALPTFPANLKQMTIAKEDWWGANRSKMSERFNAWILG
ncbi:ABC transporter substrate-binding protein [Azospirillum picis]|uniref:Spermidine/putrescine transport system substrate-binding protein n=1 Tax=Azospirillum picis TaxID=488438 RepID=A0ABU0MNK5_9PROT|nr:ABC transporter substrate-binding protein [Azospirillum picis]MBP2301788.1 putative spermidine/putrescine transport system substrate-binding protein [Azospirillum picis]MDQ0535037.1 putative spermidine/putrescine transport system substrate-binding protein [Azospirillum picis]